MRQTPHMTSFKFKMSIFTNRLPVCTPVTSLHPCSKATSLVNTGCRYSLLNGVPGILSITALFNREERVPKVDWKLLVCCLVWGWWFVYRVTTIGEIPFCLPSSQIYGVCPKLFFTLLDCPLVPTNEKIVADFPKDLWFYKSSIQLTLYTRICPNFSTAPLHWTEANPWHQCYCLWRGTVASMTSCRHYVSVFVHVQPCRAASYLSNSASADSGGQMCFGYSKDYLRCTYIAWV